MLMSPFCFISSPDICAAGAGHTGALSGCNNAYGCVHHELLRAILPLLCGVRCKASQEGQLKGAAS